jgi:hypothetical protein
MTKRPKIAIGYKDRHTREGGYPDIRTTFYEFIKFSTQSNMADIPPFGIIDFFLT